MKKYHIVQTLEFTVNSMILKVDGKKYVFRISDISEKLTQASKAEREKYEISPSGYGIHWSMIDEDLSIDALLVIKHIPSKSRERVSI